MPSNPKPSNPKASTPTTSNPRTLPISVARRVALQEVYKERVRQVELWGEQWAPGVISSFQKVSILMEEVLEVVRDVNDHDGKESKALHKELIQVAAVAVAWLESIDTEEANNTNAS